MAHGYDTIFGSYKANGHLFDGLEVPEGIDKDVVIDQIFIATQDLEVLYSNPSFLQNAITSWSRRNLPIWSRLYNTEQLEYNPIENYDRRELGTDTNTYTAGTTRTDRNSGSDTIETYVSGFNSGNTSAGTPKDKTITSPGSVVTMTNAGTDTNELKHEFRAHGNIGVTTTQEMITQERDVATFSTIGYIVDSFKNAFCLLVY